MPSKAKKAFLDNSRDIEELWKIHEEIGGQGAGRKYGVEVLNRSAIVFITACWESYVEDLASEAFDFLLTNAPTSAVIPKKVKALASKSLLSDKDPTKVWDLADGGWRALLMAHKTTTLNSWLGSFNTPKTAQVNGLYDELIGLKSLSSKWYWKGMSKENSEIKIDEFIQVRGDIAHRLNSKKVVQKGLGIKYLQHVKGLVDCCEKAVATHLSTQTTKNPW